MSGANFAGGVSSLLTTLSSAKNHYNVVKDDKRLPATFHEAGQELPLIEDTLRCVEIHLDGRDLAGDPQGTMNLLEACNLKAKLSAAIFMDVAQAQGNERFEDYKLAVRRKGEGNTAEALVLGMMNDVCDLVNDSTMKAVMEAKLKALREAIERLSKMEPSIPSRPSGNVFSSYGPGNQFNVSQGTQNNNTGSGNQFPGASFNGTVHFGRNL